jgi:hypothetical protein
VTLTNTTHHQPEIAQEEETMKTQRTGLYPTGRLETGATILAASEVVDVTAVVQRLNTFAAAHRAYGLVKKSGFSKQYAGRENPTDT